jgi:uncharacterized protein YecE (DUF72 family)
LYTKSASRESWLTQYSSVFNTVEGNSTFYALPPPATVRRWAESVRPGFRFALKFPRAISHEKRLQQAQEPTRAFLHILETLHELGRLGTSFLQLPRGFSGYHLPDLKSYLRHLPREFPYAVELRHPDFFDRGPIEAELQGALAELRVDRVILDSRPLFSDRPSDPAEQESQRRKPQVPVHTGTTGRHPLLRFIGRNDVMRAVPWVREWAPLLASWIETGLQPYVFAHTPDEQYAPVLGRLLHNEIRRHTGRVGPAARWPGEAEGPPLVQRRLF